MVLDGEEAIVATVFDLLAGNYGIHRGLEGEGADGGYDGVVGELARNGDHLITRHASDLFLPGRAVTEKA